jgi:hypothetical protein
MHRSRTLSNSKVGFLHALDLHLLGNWKYWGHEIPMEIDLRFWQEWSRRTKVIDKEPLGAAAAALINNHLIL